MTDNQPAGDSAPHTHIRLAGPLAGRNRSSRPGQPRRRRSSRHDPHSRGPRASDRRPSSPQGGDRYSSGPQGGDRRPSGPQGGDRRPSDRQGSERCPSSLQGSDPVGAELDAAAEPYGGAELDAAAELDGAAEPYGAAELDGGAGLDGGTGSESGARVRVDSLPGVLAIIPYLLGFHPADSLVIVGISARGQIKVTFRYDLPNPPGDRAAGQIASHAADVLSAQQTDGAVVVGYGPGTLVTPAIEKCRSTLSSAGIALRDLVRVQDGRYWSYLCDDPRCCPAEGIPFDPQAHPAAAELTTAGMPAYPDRATLSQSLGPVRGEAAASMMRATERALRRARQMQAGSMNLFVSDGRRSARDAIGLYRAGGQITDDDQIAWLAIVLADLRVRDDAWARMDPAFRQAHQRLWTDIMRRACQPYVPAPAALLAFTAWQSGDGAIANIALERALDADPCYSLALLLSEALESGLPPSAARLPMTPEEVAASYQDTDSGL